ncbi:hypothetical protein N7452_003988 [Penicillium brevicompactum]|uniref:Uncharacterized protein n=1 Tax=Penicillium brevicompactum TaxID=5074 RepID=A0A9W9UM49_PENBR|nr:hypothetical protein N7452_003988 [Penicillium brevicompactum]
MADIANVSEDPGQCGRELRLRSSISPWNSNEIGRVSRVIVFLTIYPARLWVNLVHYDLMDRNVSIESKQGTQYCCPQDVWNAALFLLAYWV